MVLPVKEDSVAGSHEWGELSSPSVNTQLKWETFCCIKSRGFRTCWLPQYSLSILIKKESLMGHHVKASQEESRLNTVGRGRETEILRNWFTQWQRLSSPNLGVNQKPGELGRAKGVSSKVCMPTEFLFAQHRSIVLWRPSTDWMSTPLMEEFAESTDFNVNHVQKNTLTEISKVMFDQTSQFHVPVELTHKINRHRISSTQLEWASAVPLQERGQNFLFEGKL